MGTTTEKLQAILDSKADIKDAIEAKGVTVGDAPLDEYASKIGEIQQGMTEAPENDVNFYDYDGFRVASYTKSDFLQLTSMPDNPTHEGLTAQGWNWTLSDAQSYVVTYDSLDIGQNYITSDGKTRIYITFPSLETELSLPFNFRQTVTNGVTIDWGDGSATETVAGTGKCRTTHTYQAAGNYVITLDVTSGTLILGGEAREGLFFDFNAAHNKNGTNYSLALKKVELGNNVPEIGAYNPDVTYGCIGIETITVPTGCAMSTEAFYNASRLKYCVVPSGVTKVMGLQFYNTNGMKGICFPKSLEVFGSSAFLYKSFQKIVLPPNLTTFGTFAFQRSIGLSYVVIPSSVTSIGQLCFADSYSLHNVYIYATTPPTLGSGVFRSSANDLTIHVPYSADHSILNNYQTATNWSDYASQMEEEPTT